MGPETLQRVLHEQLVAQAEKLEIEIPDDYAEIRLRYLIRRACKKFGEKAVVIVDEYDNPLLETIDNPDLHQQVRRDLRGFYSVLKASYQYLRFVFLTGITKFSHVSIFSVLNHLDDITLDPSYACICGITQEELDTNFGPEIASSVANTGQTIQEYMGDLRKFYNGYRFSRSPITVYNPFGLLLHFKKGGEFSSYWYETGSPDYLIRLLTKQKLPILAMDSMRIASDSFRTLDVDSMEADAILYQSGYLTISHYDPVRREYVLDFPNSEVSSAFAKSLASGSMNVQKKDADALMTDLPLTFAAGDIDEAINAIRAFLASIPHSIAFPSENFYETAIFIVFKMLGIKCHVEMQLLIGRIDILVVVPQYVYCFEFKIIRQAGAPVSATKLKRAATRAVAQITNNEYLLPWVRSRKKLYKIGVVIDGSSRNVGEWKCEQMDSAELAMTVTG